MIWSYLAGVIWRLYGGAVMSGTHPLAKSPAKLQKTLCHMQIRTLMCSKKWSKFVCSKVWQSVAKAWANASHPPTRYTSTTTSSNQTSSKQHIDQCFYDWVVVRKHDRITKGVDQPEIMRVCVSERLCDSVTVVAVCEDSPTIPPYSKTKTLL